MRSNSHDLVIDSLSNGIDTDGLSDLQKKIYNEKSMCVFLKYLTDKKWAECQDSKGEKHSNQAVIQKNIEMLKTMNPDDFINQSGEFYNLSEPYKIIILSRIFEFQNNENQKFNIGKSLDENIDEMWMQYKKYPVGVFENILRLRFENIIQTFDNNAVGQRDQDFSNRNDLASAIKKYLGNSGLRSETKCLLWEYYGYFSAQEDTIDAMKSKADFVDAMDVIRGRKIENQIENQIIVIDGDENYKNISSQEEKDAFLSGVLKACDNYKWNFDNTKLSSLNNSEQKIIIPHLKDFIISKDANGINRVKKQFATPDEVANFVLEGKTEERDFFYYLELFCSVILNLISVCCFLFRKDEICEVDDASAKILSVNMLNGIFYGSGVQIWLDNICKNNNCKLEDIRDFVVAELVHAACNDESYDFSYDINFSGKKSESEKDKDLEIENLLNFLVDRQKQKAIADFNAQQNKSYKPTSDKNLRYLKITVGVMWFLVLGFVALSLWLASLISVTFCFIELGLFVFHQIINFVDEHLSEENCIGKIIRHEYTQCFLYFLRLPIVIVEFVCLLGLALLLGYCACCCMASGRPPQSEEENNDEGRRAAIRALINLGQALHDQNLSDPNRNGIYISQGPNDQNLPDFNRYDQI